MTEIGYKGVPGLIPLAPVRAFSQFDGTYQRTQFPLADANALTVNSSQGSTMEYQVIHFGSLKDFVFGLAYVQITRCIDTDHFLIEDFNSDRFKFPRLDVLKEYLRYLEA